MDDRAHAATASAPAPAASGRPDRLLRTALAATRSGLQVFPVRPHEKTPAVTDWEHTATTDPARITAWWRARPYNIGIATGPSRLLVVDLDTARGTDPPPRWAGARDGCDVLRALAADAGQPFPGHTFTVITPTGGAHLYFRMPDGLALRNTAGRLGWRIDTRGHGGFVVGAGSTRGDGTYRVTRARPIAPLPPWLARALSPTPSPAPDAGQCPSWRPHHASSYLRAILDAEARQVAAAGPGTRHTTLLAAACILGRLVAGGELAEHHARSVLHQAAARHIGVHDTSSYEIATTIGDGLRYGAHRPRRLQR